METLNLGYLGVIMSLKSPLAGDINWMETIILGFLQFYDLVSPLAGDINWMETFRRGHKAHVTVESPLAGDINWMETPKEKISPPSS